MALGDGGFTVDPTALRKLAGSMRALCAFIDDARQVANQTDAQAFGSQRLANATHDFVNHWQWQAQKIGDRIQETADVLIDAAGQYQAVEDAQLRVEF